MTGPQLTQPPLLYVPPTQWTPVDASGAALSFTISPANCIYTRIGSLVFVCFMITWPATADTSAVLVGGLPVATNNTTNDIQGGLITYTDYVTAVPLLARTQHGATTFVVNAAGYTGLTNANLTGKVLRGNFSYLAAA